MKKYAPLHPNRIRAALSCLESGDYADFTVTETCIAALRLLQKSQKAMGLTPDVVDVGAAGLELMKVLTKIR